MILLLAVCLFWVGTSGQESSARAEEGRLAPGQVLRLSFPDLPRTFQAMIQADAGPAAVSVRLPDNYTPDRKFPLLVYLDRNFGGTGGDLGMPLQLTGGKDHIVASFPLFRKGYDAEEEWGIAVGFDDYAILSGAYKVILDRLRETVPNIDPTTSVIGGYSNGAKTVAVLLSALDETVLKSFRGFFMIDGGFEWTSYGRTKTLRNLHILQVVGGGGTNPDWARKYLVTRTEYFKECAEQLGMSNWKFIVVKGYDHEFPREYHPIIREWLSKIDGG